MFIMLLPANRAKDGAIRRNLWFYSFLIPTEFELDEDAIPMDRNSAWDSELPFFIKEDIKYAYENGYNIEYKYKNKCIHIGFSSENGSYVCVDEGLDDTLNSFLDKVTNFSLYKNKNGLVLYGYENEGKWFGRMEINDDKDAYMYTITYDQNLPFNENSMNTVEVRDYSLAINIEDGNCIAYYYKNAQLVARIPFSKKVKKCNIETGTIFTEDKEIYQLFVDLSDYENPTINYVYVSKFDCDISNDIFYSDEWIFKLPIFIKGKEYYTISPKDWTTYKRLSVGSVEKSGIYKKANYDMQIVKIVDYFESAEFTYWNGLSLNRPFNTEIAFNINGVKFKANYQVNGYDSNTVDLDEKEADKYCKTVYSFDEFWDNIDDIRAAYEKKYLKRPE